jgi:hypothetical protein
MKSMVNILLGATLQIWLVCIVTALATTGTQLPPLDASDRRATAATGAAFAAAVVVPTVRLNNGVQLPTMLCVATR